MIFDFMAVGLGGCLGSCLRFSLTKLSAYFNVSFPFGTLASNVIAGIAIGFIIALEPQSILLSPKTKLFLTTGLLGGLSTFSTFSLETVNFFQSGKVVLGWSNIVFNLTLSLLGVYFGLYLSKLVFAKV